MSFRLDPLERLAVTYRLISRSPDETQAIARKLTRGLASGTVILLYGSLGVGKSVFVKGIADALGIDPNEVTSPTFTLIHEYRGLKKLYHVDLYRLDRPADFDELGIDELVTEDALLAVEWADKLPRAVDGSAVRVWLEDRGGETREIRLSAERPDLLPEGGYSER